MNQDRDLLPRALAWSIPFGFLGRLGLGLVLADILLAIPVIYATTYLTLDRMLGPKAVGLLVAIMVGSHGLLGNYLTGSRGTSRAKWIRWAAGSVLTGGVFYVLHRMHPAGIKPFSYVVLLAVFAPLHFGLHLLHHGNPRSIHGIANTERSGRWCFSLMLADVLMAGTVAALAGGFVIDHRFGLPDLAWIAGTILVAHLLSLSYAHRLPDALPTFLAKLVAGHLLAVAGWTTLRGYIGSLPPTGEFFHLLLCFAPVQAAFHLWHRHRSRQDRPVLAPLQWTILTAGVLSLHGPMISNGSFGAGDSYWYRIMVADFVTQWRDGVFPVFVGQSEFAFNGAVSPLRLAPGLQHLAGMLDLATFHRMSFHGLVNLTLVASYFGGAATCFFCLLKIEPGTPWLALGLSLLFSWCPGVVGLAYLGDLFMSVTTLPFLPVLFYGCWRSLRHGDRRSVLIIAISLAAMWYCHPPIALWGTLLAAAIQLLRLGREFRNAALWRDWALAAVCFGTLTLYAFVSVGTLGLASSPVYRPVPMENMQLSFSSSLHPLGTSMIDLGNYQLGWSLWGALACGLVGLAMFPGRRPAAGLLAGILILLGFIVPAPWLFNALWHALPQTIVDVTHSWPMQRFYALLAALAACFAYATLAPGSMRRPWLGWVFFPMLVFASVWSVRQVIRFPRHGEASSTAPFVADQQLLPQNRILTRYSFNPFPRIPSYYSHGFIDPEMELRLLSADEHEVIDSNRAGLFRPETIVRRMEGRFAVSRGNPASPILEMQPALRLEPGRRYALTFGFEHPEFAGALRLIGTRMSRMYWLPDSGYGMKLSGPSRTFGTGPDQTQTITVWTDGDQAEFIRLQFIFSGPPPVETPGFARYTLDEYDRKQLPIVVESWDPFRARVRSSGDTWLETPRLFMPGYVAKIDGQAVKASASREGLLRMPIRSGEHRIELSYAGPLLLRAAYYTSLAAFAAVLTIVGRTLWVRRRLPAGAAPQRYS